MTVKPWHIDAWLADEQNNPMPRWTITNEPGSFSVSGPDTEYVEVVPAAAYDAVMTIVRGFKEEVPKALEAIEVFLRDKVPDEQ